MTEDTTKYEHAKERVKEFLSWAESDLPDGFNVRVLYDLIEEATTVNDLPDEPVNINCYVTKEDEEPLVAMYSYSATHNRIFDDRKFSIRGLTEAIRDMIPECLEGSIEWTGLYHMLDELPQPEISGVEHE